jgi:hypothetical protein
VSRPPIGTDMYSAKLWERLEYKPLQPHVGATRCAQTPACGTYISAVKDKGKRLASGRVPAMPFEPSPEGRSLEPRFDRPTARNSGGWRFQLPSPRYSNLRTRLPWRSFYTPWASRLLGEVSSRLFFSHQTGYRARASSLGTGLFVHNGMIFEVSPLIGLPNPFSSATKCLTQASR